MDRQHISNLVRIPGHSRRQFDRTGKLTGVTPVRYWGDYAAHDWEVCPTGMQVCEIIACGVYHL